MIYQELIDNMWTKAMNVRLNAYVPYSKYKVGACVLTITNKYYVGANIENIVYRSTHAEKLALDNACMAGEREILAILVITDDPKAPFPCAQCLQDITEYDIEGKGIIEIFGANIDGVIRKSTLGELLPERFSPANLDIDIREF